MIAILVVLASLGVAEDAPVGLADLEAYRVALASKPDDQAPLVRFRDLWDRPEAFAGRPVTVEGRLARLFRQPRLGEFPPLVEAWIVSPAGDPFCVVFGDETGDHSVGIGSSVRFSGTFLRRIKYQASDTARIVPLIVGPGPPVVSSSRQAAVDHELKLTARLVEWIMALGITAVVAVLFLRLHFSRQIPPRPFEPDPIFIDGPQESEG